MGCVSGFAGVRDPGREGGGGEEEEGARMRRFIDHLHGTTYFCFLACFAQGLDIIWRKDRAEG